MDEIRLGNILGALALGLADEVLESADSLAPEPGSAAAAIALMAHVPGLSIERLRRALRLSHPGTVRLVDRLERAGLAGRAPSPRDGRAVALGLTAEGKKSCARILAARGSLMAKALAILTPDERVTLGGLVEKMLPAMVEDIDHGFSICRLCDETVCVDCPVEREMVDRLTTA